MSEVNEQTIRDYFNKLRETQKLSHEINMRIAEIMLIVHKCFGMEPEKDDMDDTDDTDDIDDDYHHEKAHFSEFDGEDIKYWSSVYFMNNEEKILPQKYLSRFPKTFLTMSEKEIIKYIEDDIKNSKLEKNVELAKTYKLGEETLDKLTDEEQGAVWSYIKNILDR